MGIPETIIAAAITAVATVATALFQLYTALRIKSKPDARPKRTNTLRSVIAITALMIASAAGGYVYAEYRQQRTVDDVHTLAEELHAMHDELDARLLSLTQTTERLQKAVDVGPPRAATTTYGEATSAGLQLAEATGTPQPASPPPVSQ